jgi:hypothetical protein|tara:strand:+ start:176 stop:388 length:213 start_codon:yes stop_codon:yes gene_type:complete
MDKPYIIVALSYFIPSKNPFKILKNSLVPSLESENKEKKRNLLNENRINREIISKNSLVICPLILAKRWW